MEKIRPRLPILILQHPQEAKRAVSSVRALEERVELRIRRGFSWRSLSHAWGEPLTGPAREWLVFFLGKGPKGPRTEPIWFHNEIPAFKPKGLVFLDGTWKEVKTLWWRNAWLLKLTRAVLNPQRPSQLRFFRRAASPLGLSTAEAVLLGLEALGKPLPEGVESELVQRLFTALPAQNAAEPPSAGAPEASPHPH